MGYGAFLIMEAVILFVYKLDRSQRAMKGIVERNGLEFGTYYSSLTITFTIMLISMVLLGAIYFALVAGDIVAKENEDGNLRLVFARPISRFRLLLVKYAAVCLYTFTFVFFVGISGYLMAVTAVGWEGGLLVMEQKMKVFAAYPEWVDGAKRLALAATGIAAALALNSCTDGYGYTGVSLGYSSPGYYYDDAWGDPYWGWYGDYYYPGVGIYVYDRGGGRHRWNDRSRRYWEGRRHYWRGGDRRADWRDFRRDRREFREDRRVDRRDFRRDRQDRRDDRREWRRDRRGN